MDDSDNCIYECDTEASENSIYEADTDVELVNTSAESDTIYEVDTESEDSATDSCSIYGDDMEDNAIDNVEGT
jgi:hypothetical protein